MRSGPRSASDDGSDRVRLTRDGGTGPYTSPSVSRSGKRIAYTRGERGRVFTARLRRRGGRIRGLRGIRRIPPYRDGTRDATQFDVALSANGSLVAWVELRINVERRGSVYMVPVSGGAPRRVLRRAREPSWAR